MIEANKLKLGIFIIIGFIMLASGLLFLGLMDSFRKKYEFYTVFDESVQGLEEGAAIKYKGVTIGKVTNISVYKDRFVRVDMEADPGSITPGNVSELSEYEKIALYKKTIDEEVSKGLRCSLEISSLATGLKFIELTHITERKREVTFEPNNTDNFVPAMKSVLSGAITNFDKTLANIAKIDYEGIGIEIDQSLKNLNTILSDPNIKKLLANGNTALNQIVTTANNINQKVETLKLDELQTKALSMIENTDANLTKLITSADKSLNNSLENLNSSLNNLNTKFSSSLATIDATMKQIQQELKDAKLAETSKTARKSIESLSTEASYALKEAKTFIASLDAMKEDISNTLKSIQGAGNSFTGMRKDFTSTLKRFKVTLDSISAFVDYLENDPSSIIRGKAPQK